MKQIVFFILIHSVLIQELLAQPSSMDTVTIHIQAKPGMQYDPVRFVVRPGSYIKLIFSNVDDMEHNLIIGKKESRQKIVDAAFALGKNGPSTHYIPSIPEVLWSIPIVKSGDSDTLIFRSPRSTGVYPYVCTFPGHGSIMYGGIHVTNGILPDISADPSVPPHRRKEEANKISTILSSGHPFPLKPPYLYRVLMPYTGPAAIAVCLPDKINYCWDAGLCNLRYIWSGEFLDLTDYWTIKGELHAKILGSIFYRDSSLLPAFEILDNNTPSIRFKGYRLVDGFPQFHYFIDDIEVYELIQPVEKGKGLVRKFRLNNPGKNIRFRFPAIKNVTNSCDRGTWNNNNLVLTAAESGAFSITNIKVNQ